jgi:hypothetical protein
MAGHFRAGSAAAFADQVDGRSGSVELLLTRYVPSSVPVHAVADDANLAEQGEAFR